MLATVCSLIEPQKGLDSGAWLRLRNRIDRKTADYVICNAATMRPLAAVELDGSSHDREKTRERVARFACDL